MGYTQFSFVTFQASLGFVYLMRAKFVQQGFLSHYFMMTKDVLKGRQRISWIYFKI